MKREALARLEMIADTYLSLNAPIQLAAPVLLQQRTTFQQQLMARVRANLAELDRNSREKIVSGGCGRRLVRGSSRSGHASG